MNGTSSAWLPGGFATWAGGCLAGGSFLSTCLACSFGLFGCTGTGVCLSTGCCWLGGALAGGALHWPALLPTELKVLCFGGERPLFLSSPVAEGPDREEDGGGTRLELSSGTKPGGAPPDCAPALRCCWFGGGPCRGGATRSLSLACCTKAPSLGSRACHVGAVWCLSDRHGAVSRAVQELSLQVDSLQSLRATDLPLLSPPDVGVCQGCFDAMAAQGECTVDSEAALHTRATKEDKIRIGIKYEL